MTGKKQHYIPRFLQRGFERRWGQQERHTWVFRKGHAKPTRPMSTKSIGVNEYFYSTPQDSTIDTLLTCMEYHFTGLVSEMRQRKVPAQPNPLLLVMIMHFAFRTRWFRENTSLKIYKDKFLAKVRTPKDLAELVKSRFPNVQCPTFTEQTVCRTKEFIKLRLCQLQENNTKPFQLLPLILLGQLMGLVPQDWCGSNAQLQKEFQGVIGRMSKTLECLHYEIVSPPDESFILGDSILVFHIGGEKPYKGFWDDEEEILNAVILPIDSNKCLVGTRCGFTLDPIELREAIAQCSLEFFIATENSEANQNLHAIIGQDAQIFTEERKEALWNDVINGLWGCYHYHSTIDG